MGKYFNKPSFSQNIVKKETESRRSLGLTSNAVLALSNYTLRLTGNQI
jgi:hypothetical protein